VRAVPVRIERGAAKPASRRGAAPSVARERSAS